MSGGGGHAPPMQHPPPPPSSNGGEFLLSLLRNPNHQPQTPQQPPPQQHQQSVVLDPAVAAVGPSLSFPPSLLPSNGHDLLSPPPWPHTLSPPQIPPNFLGFPPQNPWQGNYLPANENLHRLGFTIPIPEIQHNKQQLEQKLQFGSFNSQERQLGFGTLRHSNGFERRGGGSSGGGGPPPVFSSKPRGGGRSDYAAKRREFEHNMGRGKGNVVELEHNVSRGKGNVGEFSRKAGAFLSGEEESARRIGNGKFESGLTAQLDYPGPPAGSNLHSASASDIEESLMHSEEDGKDDSHELDDLGEELVDSLLLDGESDAKKDKKQTRTSRNKEFRSDGRGQRTLSQRVRMLKCMMQCRRDIDRLNTPFLAIYGALIPPEEEKVKQKQLLMLLEKLVNKEWPEARLYLYGSCANSFGVSKSDIDVCLVIGDADINKSEFLLKLADILQSDNLQNVQALTRARVPIVKLMDPVTGISCDICINNVLAVVNTKLLRDYAQIDVRLRQLAFIIKHWAKSRRVNETYQGTLSSYAYVLMCIHFLQQRRPAILPCLQEMETTYSVTVDGVECAFFDQVDKLNGFGSRNKETIAQLVWAFFNYWAYRHDYANDVISIRTGTIISKREKDWTRRVGNDRHLICIEDPFETSHDLGRVVDKYSIKVLREEFERAADILQHDPNPSVTLFEPYDPSH